MGWYEYGMVVGNGMPQSSMRVQSAGDWDAILEKVLPLLVLALMTMSRDEIQ